MKKAKLENRTAGRIPVGGVTLAPGESASLAVDAEVQELLDGGALGAPVESNDDGADGAGQGE